MNYSITRDNGGVIAWTSEQVAYIIDKYVNENYTLKQLGAEFGCSYGTIRNLLNKNNIQSRGNKQGYPRNELYFNQINTPAKAYWLGFMYADGCVHTGRYEISMNITDLEHVEKFKNAIGAINHKITTTIDERFENAKPLYQFSIKDQQLHTDLIKWGCIPQKSLLLEKIPNIPRDYVSHFIRGYFDGDGSLKYSSARNYYAINFVGQKLFLTDIKKELGVSHLTIGTDSRKEGTVFRLDISGRKQLVRILNYIYQDSTEEIRLDRKYNRYLDCLKWAQSPLNS